VTGKASGCKKYHFSKISLQIFRVCWLIQINLEYSCLEGVALNVVMLGEMFVVDVAEYTAKHLASCVLVPSFSGLLACLTIETTRRSFLSLKS